MTPEPMSDERLKEIEPSKLAMKAAKAIQKRWLVAGLNSDGYAKFNARTEHIAKVIDTVYRSKPKAAQAIPPDVLAAMESIKNKTHCYAEVYAVALYFAKFSQERRDEVPSPVSDGQGVGE